MSEAISISRFSSRMRGKAVAACLSLLSLLMATGTAGAETSTDAFAAALYDEVQATLSAPNGNSKAGAAAPVAIYLGQDIPSKWRVVEARLAIDGVEQPVLRFSPGAAEVFAASAGRQLLARLPSVERALTASIGVRLAATGSRASAEAGQERAVSLTFTITPDQAADRLARAIELQVTDPVFEAAELTKLERHARTGSVRKAGLFGALTALSSGWGERSSYLPGGDDDPALAHARLLRLIGTPDAGEIELKLAAHDAGGESAMPPSWWLEHLRCAAALGDLDRAERLADDVQARVGDGDQALAIERLALAERSLTDGEVQRAARLLALARPALPESRQREGRDVHGRLLLALARNAEAISEFAAGSQSDEAWAYVERARPSVIASAYRRFNLAVAMLRNGDEAQGLSWLDLIGRSKLNDPDMVALRDRANVQLGWHFLEARRGRSALGVLGRVPIEGPYSDRALLGMGWALLAPPERGPARPALDDRPDDNVRVAALPAPLKASLLRLGVLEPELNGAPAALRFEADHSPSRIDEALRAAISIWQPLAARDPGTGSVIEARLAIAYAYDQLDKPNAAQAAYQDVVDALSREEEALAAHRAEISAGALHPWLEAISAAGSVADADTVARERDIVLYRFQLALDEGAGGLQALFDQQARWLRLRRALSALAVPIRTIELTGSDPAEVPDGGVGGAAIDMHPVEGSIDGDQTNLSARVDAHLGQLRAAIDARAIQLLDTRLQQSRGYRSRALFALARSQDDPGIGRRRSTACLRESCP